MISTDLSKVDEALLNNSENMQEVFNTLTGKSWRNKTTGAVVMVTNYGVVDNSMNISLSNGAQISFGDFRHLYVQEPNPPVVEQINPTASAFALLENMDNPNKQLMTLVKKTPPVRTNTVESKLSPDVYVDSDNTPSNIDKDTLSILKKAKKDTVVVECNIHIDEVIPVSVSKSISGLFDVHIDDYVEYAMSKLDMDRVKEIIKSNIRSFYGEE